MKKLSEDYPTTLTIRLPQSLLDRLIEVAERHERSMSAEARYMIRRAIEQTDADAA